MVPSYDIIEFLNLQIRSLNIGDCHEFALRQILAMTNKVLWKQAKRKALPMFLWKQAKRWHTQSAWQIFCGA